MQPSQLNSIILPNVGDTNIAVVAKAAKVALRVALRNVGPISVLLAHDAGTLTAVPAFADTYPLPADAELIVVLVPGQGLYAAGLGIGAQLALAISESIPTKWMES